jgi:hypothetical protein
MGQQLAAVRLRLDNLLIKQSIFEHPEPCVNRTKAATSPTCGDLVILQNGRGCRGFWPGDMGGWRGQAGRQLVAIAAILRYGK